MSGTMRKMGVYLGLLEGAEDDLDYGEARYADEPYPEPRPQQRPARVSRADVAAHHPDEEDTGTTLRRSATPVGVGAAPRGEVAHLSDRRRPTAPGSAAPSPASSPMSRIVTLHPRTYNEAKVIGENFRDGVPVIMNLSEMSDSDAKRLVDFAAGLIFSVRGSIERVTNKVFLLSPPNVFVAAEDKERIAEGGFFNQS